MNYTLDRYPARRQEENDTDVLDMVKATLQFTTMSGSLERLMKRKREKDKTSHHTKKAMLVFMAAQQSGEEEQPEDTRLLTKLLGRMLKEVGKRVVKAVVKPILRFAARAAMTIIRFAAQVVLRYIIVPILSAIATFVVANPLTAAAIAVAAAGTAAWYGWKKLTGKEEIMEVQAPQEIESVEQADAAHDIAEVGAQAQVEGQEQQQIETAAPAPETTIVEKATSVVSTAVTKAKKLVSGKKSKKFTGFGEDVDAYIQEATTRYPILPLADFRGFVKMEAGWTGAMSPTGAIGTGQFIQSTWDALAATPEGRAIGMTRIGRRFRTPEDPRFDKRINTLATGLLASQNAEMLRRNGLPITGENLYMMHNIGPGIIPVMLGRAASDRTLLAMRQNGMTGNMTAAQFLEFQKGRFRVAYQAANSTTSMAADQPQMAKSITVEAPKTRTAKATSKQQPLLGDSKQQGTDLIRGPGNSIVRA